MLIQGVGVCGSAWLPQVRQLSSEFQCLTLDNRGMGGSQPIGRRLTVDQMARDTLAVMSHIGWRSAHIVGHSLGGPIAMQMALLDSARVRSLSLLCTVGRGSRRSR